MTAAGVGDVGLVTPCELQPFFSGCSFDLDKEDSVPMVLRGLRGGGRRETEAVARNEALKRLLRDMS